MGQRQTAEVVIIGGGIQGVSAAYYLSQAGVKKVRLVEMDKLGSGTTYHSAGWFVLQATSKSNILLSQISLREYQKFSEMFGVDLHFQKVGSLCVTTYDHREEIDQIVNTYRLHKVPIKIKTEDEIKEMVPSIETFPGDIGLFCESDGLLDSAFILHTFKKHASLNGAIIEENVEATDIIVKKGRVVGVEVNNNEIISTEYVINAAGIHDKCVANMINIPDFPTYKTRRYTLITEKKPELLPPTLVEIQKPEAIYMSWDGPRVSYSVGLEPTTCFNHKRRLTIEDIEYIDKEYSEPLILRLPEVADLTIDLNKSHGGIRSVPGYLPESTISNNFSNNMPPPQVGKSLPILGPIDEVEGFINDCAWGGLGVSHAPAGGKIMAELITENRVTSLDITPFLLNRYYIK